jgi:oxaloacetate decarboxylase (Na+ extruding) subunit gamma
MDNIQTLMIDSLQLLFIGMGSVFIILGILIFLISMISKILPEEVVEQNFAKPKAVGHTNTQTDNKELIAVISTAISAFKKRNSTN